MSAYRDLKQVLRNIHEVKQDLERISNVVQEQERKSTPDQFKQGYISALSKCTYELDKILDDYIIL